ncbi:acyl-[acyl-carrier-protein] thioesterase [Clostridium sp. Mt-5]|uniref:Acyl-[acyl-carrier-protein] thioesterase n=1 Tax=Clostridium moutaii TaxID=3240932 RepID=A0ABV4BPQ4_9CLOT
MNRSIAEKEYEVNYYEIDYEERLLITSLVNYFGDIATKHSQDLGGGLSYSKKNGVAWVLYKWDIDIEQYPRYGQKVRVRTNACSFRKFYGYRTFEVLDQEDNVIAKANSIWLLIDINKRKILRITKDMYKIFGLTENDNKPLPIKNVKLPEKFTIEKSFNVRYSDIDTNRHVNNVKYIDWIVETIPLDIILKYTIKHINITYEKEALYGEKIKIFTELKKQDGNYVSLHKIIDDNGKELSVIEAIWHSNEI